jgi:hypothetical protein
MVREVLAEFITPNLPNLRPGVVQGWLYWASSSFVKASQAVVVRLSEAEGRVTDPGLQITK